MLECKSRLFSLFIASAGRIRSVIAVACLAGFIVAADAVEAGIIFTDGFEGGKLFADPTGYGARVVSIEATSPRSGANAVFLNNKEGVFYTLPDLYQPGTYTVSYYFKKESFFIANYSVLTFGQTGLSGSNILGGAYFEQGDLPFAYTRISYTANVAVGDAAIGNNVQLLIDQSRLGSDGDYRARLDDVQVEFTPLAAAVPEPGSVAITGLASLVFAWRVRRSRKAVERCGV